MLKSQIPPKFPIPFANGAGVGFTRPIPQASQIGIEDGAASLTDGFPPLNFTPIGTGGVPPKGQDMNGLLTQISAWSRWAAAGAPSSYDAAFSAAVGGYPEGSILAATAGGGRYWASLVDNNVTNPDTGGAGWQALTPAATNPEAEALASALRFITPANLAFLRATPAEGAARTRNDRFLTPLGLSTLFGAVTGTSNGSDWSIGPFKFKRTDFTVPANTSAQVVSFDTPFPTQHLFTTLEGGRPVTNAEENDPFTSPGTWTVNGYSIHSAAGASVTGASLSIGI